MTDYRKPIGPRIAHTEDTERLYKLEDTHREAFRECALELGRILDHDPKRFYEETLPEAILTFLDHYDRQAVRLAVGGWLEKNPEPSEGSSSGVSCGTEKRMTEKDLADIQESLDFAIGRVRYGFPLPLSTEIFLTKKVPALLTEVKRLSTGGRHDLA